MPGTSVVPYLARFLRQRQQNDPIARFYAEPDIEQGRQRMQEKTAAGSRQQYLDVLGQGQEAYQTATRGLVESSLPSFYEGLQGVRENAVRRGMTTGDLGTTYEGDLASAFQKNISNAAAQNAMGLYNTRLGAYGGLYGQDVGRADESRNRYLDLLASSRDFRQGQINAQRRRRSGLGGALGGLAGGLIGGPLGASIGSSLGGAIFS